MPGCFPHLGKNIITPFLAWWQMEATGPRCLSLRCFYPDPPPMPHAPFVSMGGRQEGTSASKGRLAISERQGIETIELYPITGIITSYLFFPGALGFGPWFTVAGKIFSDCLYSSDPVSAKLCSPHLAVPH